MRMRRILQLSRTYEAKDETSENHDYIEGNSEQTMSKELVDELRRNEKSEPKISIR